MGPLREHPQRLVAFAVFLTVSALFADAAYAIAATLPGRDDRAEMRPAVSIDVTAHAVILECNPGSRSPPAATTSR